MNRTTICMMKSYGQVANLNHLTLQKPHSLSMQSPTCQDEEEEHHDEGVAEVEDGGHHSLDVELRHKVMDAVDEEVERGESRGEETTPPPVIVLEGRERR